jgi:hypothetical protein
MDPLLKYKRIYLLVDEIYNDIISKYFQENACNDYEGEDHFINDIIYSTISIIQWKYYGINNDTSKLFKDVSSIIFDDIKKNHIQDLKSHYKKICRGKNNLKRAN